MLLRRAVCKGRYQESIMGDSKGPDCCENRSFKRTLLTGTILPK